MTTDEIRRLAIEEKFQIMEALWDDLRERFDRFEIPEEHERLLDRRRERVQKGEAQLHDWDPVKGSIGRA